MLLNLHLLIIYRRILSIFHWRWPWRRVHRHWLRILEVNWSFSPFNIITFGVNPRLGGVKLASLQIEHLSFLINLNQALQILFIPNHQVDVLRRPVGWIKCFLNLIISCIDVIIQRLIDFIVKRCFDTFEV